MPVYIPIDVEMRPVMRWCVVADVTYPPALVELFILAQIVAQSPVVTSVSLCVDKPKLSG